MAYKIPGLEDVRAYFQVIGCLMQDNTLIDDLNRPLAREDFNTNDFYELLFVGLYNLCMSGAQVIDEFAMDSYLGNFKEQYKIFQTNDGVNWLHDAKDMAELGNYDYYYSKVRKLSLLRYYESKGYDTRRVYDTTLSDSKAAEAEQLHFDNMTTQDIVDQIEGDLVLEPKAKYCANMLAQSCLAGDGLDELTDELMESPDFGYPFTSIAFNTVSYGAARGKFILRSAGTSVGKTRNFLMDACNFSIPYVWDPKKKDFVYTGHRVPTLFIGTEGSLREFKTIVQATVSGVNEAHIKKGKYEPGELERVRKANQYIKESPLYLVYCDDFSISDIENMAKRYVLQYNIEVLIFDYLQTSLRMISEISQGARVKLQEYQLLLIFATRLKALAERLDICVISGTQLNGEANEAKYKTSQVLQGSKAIAQKVDVGCILSRPNPAERKKLDIIMHNMINVPEVNLLTWCYKVRAGELSSVIICSHIDLGTMKIKDCFITDFDFNLIDVDFTQIEVMNEVLDNNSVDIEEVDMKNDPKYNVDFDPDTGEIFEKPVSKPLKLKDEKSSTKEKAAKPIKEKKLIF